MGGFPHPKYKDFQALFMEIILLVLENSAYTGETVLKHGSRL